MNDLVLNAVLSYADKNELRTDIYSKRSSLTEHNRSDSGYGDRYGNGLGYGCAYFELHRSHGWGCGDLYGAGDKSGRGQG